MEPLNPEASGPAGAASAVKFNPFLPEFQADPYPHYHRLRAEDPIHRTRNYFGESVLTRFADVKAVLRDSRFEVWKLPRQFEEKSRFLAPMRRDLRTLAQVTRWSLLFLDPPEHTRLRARINKAFSRAAVIRMTSHVQEIVDELLDRVRDRRRMDLITDFAGPLPALAIGRMLGAPDADRDPLTRLSDELGRVLDPMLSLETLARLDTVAGEFQEYLKSLFARRRAEPRDDLISALLALEETGERLGEDALVSLCMLLFIAGQETVANLLGNWMLALLQQPDQRERLQREPERVPDAVDEMLRHDSPVQLVARVPREDAEIAGATIRAGERVTLCLGAANRDPSQFSDPDRLDLTRCPHRHLAFGDGIHYCVGALLARVEGTIAIRSLIQRLPDLRLATDRLERRENIALRGLRTLPVTF
jgi:cytochrome P450